MSEQDQQKLMKAGFTIIKKVVNTVSDRSSHVVLLGRQKGQPWEPMGQHCKTTEELENFRNDLLNLSLVVELW